MIDSNLNKEAGRARLIRLTKALQKRLDAGTATQGLKDAFVRAQKKFIESKGPSAAMRAKNIPEMAKHQQAAVGAHALRDRLRVKLAQRAA